MRTRLLDTRGLLLIVLTVMLGFVACGSPSEQQKALEEAGLVEPRRDSLEAAAKVAFDIWAQQAGTPYRNRRYYVVHDDGTFATVRIMAELRERREEPWREHETRVECKKVGKQWQCARRMYFQLTQAEQEKIVAATATAEAEAEAAAEALVTLAQEQMALAEQVDEATARGHLLQALNFLAEAERLRPGKLPVDDLRDSIMDRLKEIDPVKWEYNEPGSDPGRVIVNGIDIYVLDKGLDRVYKHLLDDTLGALQELEVGPVILRKDDQRDPVVGELVDMAWVEAKRGEWAGSLLVLESGGSLVEYDPTRGRSVLSIGGSDRWIEPQIVGSYGGNFYLLDPGLNQILRYEPDYDGLPGDYFATTVEVDLAGVVDMAIDGQIYILYADGRTLKFLDGQPAPFELVGLYEPLRNPTAIFTSEETEFVYIADAGNKRIVQLTKEGRFLRQFKADEGEALDQLKGLFVNEMYHRLYFVSGNKLCVTNIPSE